MKKILLLVAVSLCVLSLSAQRNSKWATPVQAKYVENMFKVDKDVYRCGQPDENGFIELEKMGIKEVLNLRNFHSDDSKAKKTNLVLHRVKMKASDSDWDKLVKALKIINNRKGPIVFHCKHGSDRTGIVCALYRLVFQDWTKEEALDELENGGYGYHAIFGNIKTFIRSVDVEKLREAVME